MSAIMSFIVPFFVAFLLIKMVTFLAGIILLKKPIFDEEMVIQYQEGEDFFLAGKEPSRFNFSNNSKMIETKDYYILFRGNLMQDGIAIPKFSSLDEGYEERVGFLIRRIQSVK